MNRSDPDVHPIEDPIAHLEQGFIDEFIRLRGHDPARLRDLAPGEVDELRRHATAYASAKLAEVEARAHDVRELHWDRCRSRSRRRVFLVASWVRMPLSMR